MLRAASVAWRTATHDDERWLWLTALVSDTTMALVEHGALLGPRQLDMRNSGLVVPADRAYVQSMSKVILKCKACSFRMAQRVLQCM